MKRRWKITLAAGFVLALTGVGLTLRNKAELSVDESVVAVTSFSYDFLAMAAYRGLSDLMPFSQRGLEQQAIDACEALKHPNDPDPPYCPTMTVLQGGDIGVFLFSDAGGDMILTDTLIDTCGAPDMLPAVIAHELGHSAHLRDGPNYQYWTQSTRRVLAQLDGGARTQLLWDEFEDGAEMIRANPRGLVTYAFTPEEETVTTDHAEGLLRRAGLPADGFDRCLQILRDTPTIPGTATFLKTHASELTDAKK